MIIGDPALLALESDVLEAYSRKSLRALGRFRIHVSGVAYGRDNPDATMLANSLDGVRERISARGSHVAPFVEGADAGQIADAVRYSIYSTSVDQQRFFDLTRSEFVAAVHASRIIWAPDGDEAFDDTSMVLQMDECDGRVRVIAFKSTSDSRHQPGTLREVRMRGGEYYDLLERWSAAFENQWLRMPKAP